MIFQKILFPTSLIFSMWLPALAQTAPAEVTVCANGCDETTISTALNTVAEGGIIRLLDAVHTENLIFVDKDVTIEGLGQDETILESRPAQSNSNREIFEIFDADVTLRQMTMRHAGTYGTVEHLLGHLTVEDVTFTKNRGLLGALELKDAATVVRCTFEDNESTGTAAISGRHLNGTLTIRDSQFFHNLSAYTIIDVSGPGFVVENSTFHDNILTSSWGRVIGIHVDAEVPVTQASMTNTTIAFNTHRALGVGGDGKILDILNCTVAYNDLGLETWEGPDITIRNSIFAGNPDGDVIAPAGTVQTAGTPNLCGDGDCPDFSLLNTDPQLGQLGDHGGLTPTFDLLLTSPAIDAGDSDVSPATDQVGTSRPQGSASDLGAFELPQAIADLDKDGVPDSEDMCPDTDTRATLMINGCDTGIPNPVSADGCTLSDLLSVCEAGNPKPWQFRSCAGNLTQTWVNEGRITAAERAIIMDCAWSWGLPNPEPDSFTTDWSTPLAVGAPGLLTNDTDPNGDPLETHLETAPDVGHLSLGRDGSFTYTPIAGYSGDVTFVYRAWDATSGHRTATATITVAQGNQFPVVTDDAYSVKQGTRLIVPSRGVLANDYDPDGGGLVSYLMTSPDIGHLGMGNDGSFWYDAPAGFTGTATFTYRAHDGDLYTEGTVTLTLLP